MISILNKNNKKSFTPMETLVGVAVFLVISVAFYQAYASLFILISLNQYKILALDLANEEFEIIRNLSYANVGEVSGIPNGTVPHVQNITRGGVAFVVTTTIRNVDLPFDGLFPVDTSPADNKLVEVEVDCPTCQNYTPVVLTTTVAPKNLETASTNGALFVKVFDANGVPISNANVHIVNSQVNPNIIIDDVTNDSGMLEIVDVPPGNQAYSISVSKPGYSSDRTYPPGGTVNGVADPSPTIPDATVALQQVTQVSFSIDKLSTIAFSSVSPTCSPIGGIDFNLTGSKNIGVGIPKFSQNLVTDGSGLYSSSTMEWDSYNLTGIDSAYDIVGVNPLNPISLNPNSTQNVMLIVAPKNPKSLLVTVKDNATGLPVTNATVEVTGPNGYDQTQITDRGYINQTDWSGGSGQSNYTNVTQYATDDGNIDTGSPAGEIKLKNDGFGNYSSSGMLESSTIDTGSASNFQNLIWLPNDEPLATGPNSVLFQFAATNTPNPTSWNYTGPDGTGSTYYSTPTSVFTTQYDGNRYVRYKAYLQTQSATNTPNISDVSFTFTSSCTPPGQVVFSGLSSGTYTITVSKSGYTTSQTNVTVSSNWIEQPIILAQ